MALYKLSLSANAAEFYPPEKLNDNVSINSLLAQRLSLIPLVDPPMDRTQLSADAAEFYPPAKLSDNVSIHSVVAHGAARAFQVIKKPIQPYHFLYNHREFHWTLVRRCEPFYKPSPAESCSYLKKTVRTHLTADAEEFYPSAMLNDDVCIKSVMADGLELAFQEIKKSVRAHHIISIDTEFPGTLVRPARPIYKMSPEESYSFLKLNVDQLKLIQLGLTFSDSRGRVSRTDGVPTVWEFNFNDFDPLIDPQAPESITLLRSHGLDLERHRSDGCPSGRFAELLFSTGLIGSGSSDITWVTYHGSYDIALFVKILTSKPLPDTLPEFLSLVRSLFGENVFDIKQLLRSRGIIKGGLDNVAESVGAKRSVGVAHNAGSDSLLTSDTFIRIVERFFEGGISDQAGQIYSLTTL